MVVDSIYEIRFCEYPFDGAIAIRRSLDGAIAIGRSLDGAIEIRRSLDDGCIFHTYSPTSSGVD